MAAEKPTVSKSDFIRQQPPQLSAAEVVDKAKASGLTIDPGLVYNVRGRAKAKRKATKVPAKPVTKVLAKPVTKVLAKPVTKVLAKPVTKVLTKPTPGFTKPSAKKTSPIQSKADFVRRFPNSTPKEIVQKAVAAGIQIGVGYVYNVRSSGSAAKKSATVPKPTPKPNPTTVGRHPGTSERAEGLLRALAAEIGLGRATEILAGQRAIVRAVLGNR
jgi:hypothetical protein